MQSDVIIVGAGVIGLTLALALGQANLRVMLLEKQAVSHLEGPLDLSEYDKRVFAINWHSQQLFKALNVWEAITARRVSPYQSMQVWDSAGGGHIQFHADMTSELELGHIIEQKVILKSLWDAIKRCDRIELLAPCELSHLTLTPHQANLYLQGENSQWTRLQAPLIIGADGVHSWVRAQAGISTRGWSYGQSALVATIKSEKAHQQTARQRFAPEGPLALLPLDNPHVSSIVWMIAPEQADALKALLPEAFETTLTERFGSTLGRLSLVDDKRVTFPLKMQQASHYCQTGCALVGDAAQVIHPLAGLGMNLGLHNVAILSEAIKMQHAKGRPLGDSAYLKQYERQEKSRAMGVIATMEAFKQGFGTPHPVVRHLRNSGLNFVNQQAFLKKCFIDLAMGK